MNHVLDMFLRDAFSQEPFSSYRAQPKVTYPLSILRYKDSISYEIAAIGLDKEDIEVNLENRKLTVKALNPRATLSEEYEILYNTIKGANFNLEFLVPDAYDVNTVAVSLDKGLLKINIAKSEQAKPKRLTISSAPLLDETKQIEEK